MKLEQNELRQLQEQQLDDLIRLAYRCEEEADVQATLAAFDAQPEDACEVDEATQQAAFGRAMKTIDAQISAARRQKLRRFATRFASVAAVILLLLAIAAPIAVANIDLLRSEFGWFFFSDTVEDDDLSVNYHPVPPAGFNYMRPSMTWTGLYLPAYVPEGYVSDGCVPEGDGCYLTLYHEGSGDYLRFAEQLDAPQPLSGSAVLRWVSMNGGSACVERAENGDLVVTWYAHVRWYRLRSGLLPEAELLAIAGSLAPYAGEEVLHALQAQSVGGAAIPAGYDGQFFPTWTPSGFACTEVSDMVGMYAADFRAEDGRVWLWMESAGDASMLDGNGGEPVMVDIGSATGAMYCNEEYVTILWMNEMRMLYIKGKGMTQEELLRIARSVRLIDRTTAQESLPVVQPTPTATPAPPMTLADWSMPYVPTWCPEGCFEPYASGLSEFGARLFYEYDNGERISLTVNRSEIRIFDNTEYLMSLPVDVNGVRAHLTFSPLGAGGLHLYWQADGYYFLISGTTGQAETMVRLARSIRPGKPEEIAATPRQSVCEPDVPCAEPMQHFPAALLAEYEVISSECVLDGMNRVTLLRTGTDDVVHLAQLAPTVELLVAGGPDFNVTRAQMEIAGRQVTVYTPTDDSGWAPTALMWREETHQYMLLSTLPHETLYAIVGMMEPVADAAVLATPTPLPAETPVPQKVPAVWAGEHFITCVPAGYSLASATADHVLWRDAAGNTFLFLRMPDDWSIAEECEGAQDAFSGTFRGHWSMTVIRFDEESFGTTTRFIFPVDGCWYAIEGDRIWDVYANYVQKIE